MRGTILQDTYACMYVFMLSNIWVEVKMALSFTASFLCAKHLCVGKYHDWATTNTNPSDTSMRVENLKTIAITCKCSTELCLRKIIKRIYNIFEVQLMCALLLFLLESTASTLKTRAVSEFIHLFAYYYFYFIF